MKTLEITANITKRDQLQLEQPLPPEAKGRVRVLIMLPDEEDIPEAEWLHAASTNPVFQFLNDPEEDIYTEEDGKPFEAEE